MRRYLVVLLFAMSMAKSLVAAEQPIDIGSRLELFVDHYLVDKTSGDAQLQLHKPTPRDVVLVTDEPWEGNTCAYYTIFQDGDLFRMYYRGAHFDVKARKSAHRELTCYAESNDGIHWTKPELGIFEFEGSKENNIVWSGVGTHNFTAFRDDNPAAPDESRYKAFGRSRGGLLPFQSPDGKNWKLSQDEPVITHGAFDSQNLAFWDADRSEYRAYWRYFGNGVRSIRTATSKDFITWEDEADLAYAEGTPREHLYTNAIQKYFRAPHLFIGFPTRYEPKSQQVEPILMTSRDGYTFHRYAEAVIPRTAPKDRNQNRSNYMTWGLVELPGDEKEISVYATEAYYSGPDSRVRRFTYRTDGFVSVRASARGGELTTKPLRFQGDQLVINFRTSPKGSVRIEIQDEQGKPIEHFGLADCTEMRGDDIEHIVAWKDGCDLSDLSGRPVRLRFAVQDGDVYSFQFR